MCPLFCAHGWQNRLNAVERAEEVDVELRKRLLGSMNSTAPEMPKPALLTNRSICPSAASTCATALLTCSGRVTSAAIWRMPSASAPFGSAHTVYPLFEKQQCGRFADSAAAAGEHADAFHFASSVKTLAMMSIASSSSGSFSVAI